MIPREILKRIRQIKLRTARAGTGACFLAIASLVLCSCATKSSRSDSVAALQLPAEVDMNEEAGRGGFWVLPVRLKSGEEVRFAVDTGASGTCLDLSLAPKLGVRVGTVHATQWGKTVEYDAYRSPALFLGDVQLLAGESPVVAMDLKEMPPAGDQRVLGVLGMDVLRHYCIQLDFTANKIRFLKSGQSAPSSLGKAFPIVDMSEKDWRPGIRGNLLGAEGPRSLIDSGYLTADGWLMAEHYKAWTNQAVAKPGEARSPEGRFFGESYPQIDLDSHDVEADGIGLTFLARHLVTLDFPAHTLYLKRTSDGPLPKPAPMAAMIQLKVLKDAGKLPNWSKDDHGVPHARLGPARNMVTVEATKNGESGVYHYEMMRIEDGDEWKLQKAWRTTETGEMLEEYPIR